MSMGNKSNILQLLRERSDFISGQEICNRLGVSRTAVWKAVNRLKEEGHKIEAIQNKGYRLKETGADILTVSEMESRLETDWAGRTLYYLEETGSTNIDAKRLAEGKDGEEPAPHGTIVVTDKQSAGRGRRGRSWESPSGTNAFFSILLRPEFHPEKASALTLIMALAVSSAVEELTSLRAGIKWPNDIVVNQKKICGILTEMNAELDYIQYVVIGTGINVNMEEFPEEIKEKATSLLLEGNKRLPRAAVITKVLLFFERYYKLYTDTLDLSLVKDIYNSRLVSMNQAVTVLEPAGDYNGISRGITDGGELIVDRDTGERVHVYAGEVSVRGVYGYV